MPWNQIRFGASQSDAESFSDLLFELGAASVTFEDAEDQPILEPPPGATPLWEQIEVVGLFDAEINIDLLRIALLPHLNEVQQQSLKIASLEEQNWVRAWMDDFHPMQFGKRLWIVPSWSKPVDPDAANILLDPGLAFGTGTHPTTALCMEWLDQSPPENQIVIDYGCGSGILALAASKLGATVVHGVDNDPQALQATQENAEKNELDDQIKTYLPEAFQQEQENLQADVLVANILAGPLQELAPTLEKYLKPGGKIVLSGILREQAQDVMDAYRSWFEFSESVIQEEWGRLDGIKIS